MDRCQQALNFLGGSTPISTDPTTHPGKDSWGDLNRSWLGKARLKALSLWCFSVLCQTNRTSDSNWPPNMSRQRISSRRGPLMHHAPLPHCERCNNLLCWQAWPMIELPRHQNQDDIALYCFISSICLYFKLAFHVDRVWYICILYDMTLCIAVEICYDLSSRWAQNQGIFLLEGNLLIFHKPSWSKLCWQVDQGTVNSEGTAWFVDIIRLCW